MESQPCRGGKWLLCLFSLVTVTILVVQSHESSISVDEVVGQPEAPATTLVQVPEDAIAVAKASHRSQAATTNDIVPEDSTKPGSQGEAGAVQKGSSAKAKKKAPVAEDEAETGADLMKKSSAMMRHLAKLKRREVGASPALRRWAEAHRDPNEVSVDDAIKILKTEGVDPLSLFETNAYGKRKKKEAERLQRLRRKRAELERQQAAKRDKALKKQKAHAAEEHMMDLLHDVSREHNRNVVPSIVVKPAKVKPHAKKKLPKKENEDVEPVEEEFPDDCRPPFCLPHGLETSRREKEKEAADWEASLHVDRHHKGPMAAESELNQLLHQRTGTEEKAEKKEAARKEAQKKHEAEAAVRRKAKAEAKRKAKRDAKIQKEQDAAAYDEARQQTIDELQDEMMAGHVSKHKLEAAIQRRIAQNRIKASLTEAHENNIRLARPKAAPKPTKSKAETMHELLTQAGHHRPSHHIKKHKKKHTEQDQATDDSDVSDEEREVLEAMGISVEQ